MLTQILVIIVVLIGAVLFTRIRDRPPDPQRRPPPPTPDKAAGRPSRRAVAGYSLLGLMLVGALVVYWLQWQDAHQVVTVRVVTGGGGEATVYQVFKKNLGRREFQTVDGRFVSLGDGDRMELSER